MWFQTVSNKWKECYHLFSPTKFASAQFNAGTTAEVRDLLKCNKVTIFLESWTILELLEEFFLKGLIQTHRSKWDLPHWFQEGYTCTVDTNAALAVDAGFEGKPLLPLPTAFIIHGDKITHCIHWHEYWPLRPVTSCDENHHKMEIFKMFQELKFIKSLKPVVLKLSEGACIYFSTGTF